MQREGNQPFEVQTGDERLTWPELEGIQIGIQTKDLVMDCAIGVGSNSILGGQT